MVSIVRYDDLMARTTKAHTGAGWQHLTTFVVAHAVGVTAGSLALAVTGVIMVMLQSLGVIAAETGSPVSPLLAVGGSIFVVFLGIVGGSVFALPASLVGYPMARWVARKGVHGAQLLALGGAAGVIIGLPLLVTTFSLGDATGPLASIVAQVLAAVPTFGPAALTAGASFAWMVDRLGWRDA